jgi:hypothetical protein
MLTNTIKRWGRRIGIGEGRGHNCPACREVRLGRLIGQRIRPTSVPSKFNRQAGQVEACVDILAAEDCIDPHAAPLVRLGQGDYIVEIKP